MQYLVDLMENCPEVTKFLSKKATPLPQLPSTGNRIDILQKNGTSISKYRVFAADPLHETTMCLSSLDGKELQICDLNKFAWRVVSTDNEALSSPWQCKGDAKSILGQNKKGSVTNEDKQPANKNKILDLRVKSRHRDAKRIIRQPPSPENKNSRVLLDVNKLVLRSRTISKNKRQFTGNRKRRAKKRNVSRASDVSLPIVRGRIEKRSKTSRRKTS